MPAPSSNLLLEARMEVCKLLLDHSRRKTNRSNGSSGGRRQGIGIGDVGEEGANDDATTNGPDLIGAWFEDPTATAVV